MEAKVLLHALGRYDAQTDEEALDLFQRFLQQMDHPPPLTINDLIDTLGPTVLAGLRAPDAGQKQHYLYQLGLLLGIDLGDLPQGTAPEEQDDGVH